MSRQLSVDSLRVMSEPIEVARSSDRPMNGFAIASFLMALVAAASTQIWLLSTVIAISALCTSLTSRRALRQNPNLRGTSFSLLAFPISIGVLLVTVGPLVYGVLMYALNPGP